jgi:hypothetical protein
VRDLRVVGVSDDGRHLLLAAASDAAGQFRIPIDATLRAAVRGHLDDARLDQRAEQPMSPREIQSRIRAGESVEELAQSSGLAIDRLVAFAYPVLAERRQAVQQAREARAGDDDQPLGEIVDQRLDAQDVDLDAAEWDAWRGPDGRWTVQLVYPAHGRLQCASWRWDPLSRRAVAADAQAEAVLRGGPATHGAASVAARQAALFGTPAAVPPDDPVADPVAESAAPVGLHEAPAPARARRAAVPSWNEIRETARMPSVQPAGEPAE